VNTAVFDKVSHSHWSLGIALLEDKVVVAFVSQPHKLHYSFPKDSIDPNLQATYKTESPR